MSERPRFILSVPHSGTHALANHLGYTHLTMIRTKQAGLNRTADAAGHTWDYTTKKADRIMPVEDWVEVLEHKDVYMPVREPGALAHSWALKNRALEQLRGALGVACELIRRLPVTLVDIRPLKPANVQGDGGRDAKTGVQLLRDFPLYFGAYYGRQAQRG